MSKALLFCRAVDWINRLMGQVAGVIVVAMILLVSLEVFLRYVVHKPTIWGWDILVMMLTFVGVVGAGSTLLAKGHVKIEILVDRLPKKGRAAADIFTSSFFFLSVVTLFWLAMDAALRTIASGETLSSTWKPSLAPIRLMWVIGVALLFLQGLAHVIRNVAILTGKDGAK